MNKNEITMMMMMNVIVDVVVVAIIIRYRGVVGLVGHGMAVYCICMVRVESHFYIF